jgi:hypothetical protein
LPKRIDPSVVDRQQKVSAMSTVVKCPACQRKLKVAPASVGKSVRCTCGQVFKARDDGAAAAPSADTLMVACDGCGTRLKVPASARGRKMKCSKCATIFVVTDTAALVPPVKVTPAVHEVEEEPVRSVKPAGRPAPPILEDDNAEPMILEDEPVEEPRPRPQGKTRPQPTAVPPQTADKAIVPQAKARSGGCLLNLFVLLLVVAYAGVLLPMYYEMIDWLPFSKPPSAPAVRPIPGGRTVPEKRDAQPENDAKEAKADET